nr:hypothetical protein [Candidatus Njordarchaeota archaeon]
METKSHPDQVVYTCIRETGRSFARRDLTFPIYSVEARAASSLSYAAINRAAYRLFESNEIPTGVFCENNRYFLISTKSFDTRSMKVEVEGQDIEVEIKPTKFGRSPMGLYIKGQKFAIQNIWTRSLTNAMRKEAVEHGFDPVHGLFASASENELRNHVPSWLPERRADELFSHLQLDAGRLVLDDGTKLVEPRRYVDVDPKIGLTGKAYVMVNLKTRMLPPDDFTFRRIIGRRQWDRFSLNPDLMFELRAHGRRLRFPRTVMLESIINGPAKNVPYKGTTAAESITRLLRQNGITLSSTEIQNIEDSDKICYVVPYVFPYERSEPIPMIPSYMLPILTTSNFYIFEKMAGVKELAKDYHFLVSMPTEVKAALTETICRYLSEKLHPELLVEGSRISIDLVPGPVTFIRREQQRSKLHREITGLKTYEIDDFRFVELPEVKIFIRKDNTPQDVSLSALSDYVFSEGCRAHVVSRILKDGVRLALVCPQIYKKASSLIQNTFSFDPEKVMPASQRGKGHPLKNLDYKLLRLQNFFEAKPFDVKLIELPAGRYRPEDYEEGMKDGIARGCDAFLVVMPLRVDRETQDEIYVRTYNFALANDVPVIHYNADTWNRGQAYYHVVFTALAHLNNRLAGLTYYVNLGGSASFLNKYAAPRFVAIDLAQQKKDNVGLVTATGPSLEDVEILLTARTKGINDAVQKVGEILLDMTKELSPDLLIILKDNHFQSVEYHGLSLPYEKLKTHVLAIEVLKSGNLSGFGLTAKGRGGGIKPTVPYGTSVITPDGDVHLFPHLTDLSFGIWSSIRYSVTHALPGDEMMYLPEDIAMLGAALSATGSHHINPERTKFPDLLGKADKAADLLARGGFNGLKKTRFSARLVE